MEQLKQESVKRLVYRAVKAGNKQPSLTQLQTLALAVGDRPSWQWLKQATLRDKVAVKNCISAIVYGEEPQKVSRGVGAFFGMAGGKEGQIASEDQEKIYTPKPVARTTEEQKDMAARRKVPQEEKQPLTSDRATVKPAVAEPLKPKTDPKFQAILDRHKKHQDEITKETQTKTAGLSKTAGAQEYTIKFRLDGIDNSPSSPIHTKMTRVIDRTTRSIEDMVTDITNGSGVFTLVDTSSAAVKTADGVVEADIEKYTSRIKKGEAPELVLREALASVKKSELTPGDTVKVNQPQGKGEVQLTIDSVGRTPDNSMAVTGKDPSGNIMAGEVMVVPDQSGAMTGTGQNAGY